MKILAALPMPSMLHFSPAYPRVEKPETDSKRLLNTAIQKKTKNEIKPLRGTTPFGVEKRPMPAGSNLDKLLPKQTGPPSISLKSRSR